MASNQAPVVDRIRIIPRSQEFLDRNVGSSGEVFYNRETNSLRLYNGNDRGGYEVAILNNEGALDLTSQKNKIRFHWDTLADLQAEVNPVTYHGMIAHVHDEGRLYFAHAAQWVPVANFSELSEAGSGASVDVSDTPPSSPSPGNIWFNSTNARLYVYVEDSDSSQWVQPAAPFTEVSAFSSIKLNDSSELSAQGLDSLNFVDGPGIEISNDSTSNTIIISATGGVGIQEGDDVTFGSVSAEEFINVGVGTPSITSASTITFTAPDGVIVNSGPFRLPNLTSVQILELTPQNGDMIYNTTANRVQVYQNGAWINLDDGTAA